MALEAGIGKATTTYAIVYTDSFKTLWTAIALRRLLLSKKEEEEHLSEILTVGEAARELMVSEGTVRTWSDRGKLPVMRTSSNSMRLFRREDVTRMCRQRREAREGEDA